MHFLLSSLSSAKKRSDGSKRGWKTIQNQYGLLRWWQKSWREKTMPTSVTEWEQKKTWVIRTVEPICDYSLLRRRRPSNNKLLMLLLLLFVVEMGR